jgi:REP element-mobilizing transposase RayT
MEAELMSLPPSLRSPEQEKRVNAYLDAGHGSCILRDPFIAELIDSTLLHFHGDRYTLYAWCIMPNHVHVLFQPEAGWTMSKIVASWKSFTGRRISAHRKSCWINYGLGPRTKIGGGYLVWQPYATRAFYQHRQLSMNPVKARLVQSRRTAFLRLKSDDRPIPGRSARL